MTEHDPIGDEVRRALQHEAEQVQPDPDGLYRIREKIDAGSGGTPVRSRRPWVLTTAGAALGTAAAVGAFALLSPGAGNDTTTAPEVANSTTAPPSPSGTTRAVPPETLVPKSSLTPERGGPTGTMKSPNIASPADDARAVPVYWLGAVAGRPDLPPRLYRTFVRVADPDPAAGAVRVMATGRADDPDYGSPWQGAEVRSVTRADGVITVDFDTLPGVRLSQAEATAAVQELVYTVQGALQSTDPVRVTLDGGPAGRLFGQADLRSPVRRAAPIDVQAFVWITSPAENGTAGRPLSVAGIASTFEATVNWRVRDAATNAVVQEGHTMATRGTGEFGDFRFNVTLPAGKYVVECFEYSAEDGRQTNTDSKTVTVR
jgi:immunoglobulin-like protein involved in spore germination/sporulation and spore germination protein